MKKTALTRRSLGEVGPKLIIFFLFAIPYTLFAVSPAFAQTTTVGGGQEIAPQYLAPNTSPDVPKNLHTWTQNIMIEVMAALSCQLTGIDPTNPNGQCLGVDPKNGKIGYVQSGGGAIGAMGGLIAMTYTPPFHLSDYTDNLAANFGIVKQAHAAGTGQGFLGLTPLVKLWIVFRNIVYMFFVIMFVVIGFAIMLRLPIDQRTVISIENQLPKIIVGLILVTFSFAIVGLMIDLMYLCMYMAMNILGSPDIICPKVIAQGIPPTAANCDALYKMQHTQQTFSGGNPFGIFNDLIGIRETAAGAAGGIKDIVSSMFGTPVTNLLDVIKNGVGALLGWVAGILAFLIIAVAILVALFRLWFELIKAYIYILLHTVFAPFWVLGGLIPGSPISFSGWLREMISNFSAFPVTIAMFMLGKIFQQTVGDGAGQTFVPPLLGNPGDTSAFGNLIAMGIILITPQVLVMMKDLLKAPPFKYSASVGQHIGIGAGFPTSVGKGIGATITSARETVLNTAGGHEERGIPRALLGRIFGR